MIHFAADTSWQDHPRSITIQNHTFDRKVQSRQLTTSVLKYSWLKSYPPSSVVQNSRNSVMHVGAWTEISLLPSLGKKKKIDPTSRYSFRGRVVPLWGKLCFSSYIEKCLSWPGIHIILLCLQLGARNMCILEADRIV